MRILVVDDEQRLRENICTLLKSQNYESEGVSRAEEALDRLYEHHYDLIILDIMMENMSGLQMLQSIREAKNNIAVLMLSARDCIEDKIEGLDIGADDYMSKPFSNLELLARIRSLLRRESQNKSSKFRYKHLLLDQSLRIVESEGIRLDITAKQFKILELFLSNNDIVFTKLQLSEYIWGEECTMRSANAIDAHLKNLRKKIGNDIIETIRSIGYICRRDR